MDLNKLIDHTNLRQDARQADIERLCDEAVRYGFATVCVNSCWVPMASARLAGTGVGVSRARSISSKSRNSAPAASVEPSR